MELITALTRVRARNTCRLIPSLYPSEGILDRIASPEDLPFLFELESWTNDRISNELGLLHRIPPEEWVAGRPMASVVMAAFCHPRPGGGRFNGPDRGAWYAARDLETAQAEVAYHRTLELAEIGVWETRLEMRLYLAGFDCAFHDVRPDIPAHIPLHDPDELHGIASIRARAVDGRIERRDLPQCPAPGRRVYRVLPSGAGGKRARARVFRVSMGRG